MAKRTFLIRLCRAKAFQKIAALGGLKSQLSGLHWCKGMAILLKIIKVEIVGL
jgi:hypothetical protein